MAPRHLVLGAAQLGPIARDEPRARVVSRMIDLMRQAKARGCQLVAFPELALTSFFPRWYMEDWAEVDRFFEDAMPSPATHPLFDAAKALGLGLSFGYAERVREGGRIRRFNTSIIVNAQGDIVSKYRKVHLPGHVEHEPQHPFQHLEKRYFEVGDLGWPVIEAFGARMGLCICNDRRWPETWRMLGLQGVDIVLVGYNTPLHDPDYPETDRLAYFQSQLVVQAAAYQNCTWIASVAKAGREEGCDLIGGTLIAAPTGEIVAQAVSLEDELIAAQCDLDLAAAYRAGIFNFKRHRQPHLYGPICASHQDAC
jgi:N-carbamoyl-D-amino-acid hydrolase